MIREKLVGTALGRIALSLRDTAKLLRTPREALGTASNDFLAIPLLVSLCRPGETFLDIGAHIGSVIAEVRHRCPGARVEAVEAIPAKVAKLRRRFPDVIVHECALAEEEGTATFYIDEDASGCSSLAERPHGTAITVVKRRLDDLVEHADLIKLDVEGAELGVLRGAESLVVRSRPVIMFESGPEIVLGFSKEDLFGWFAERDYGLYAPNRLAGTGGAMSLDGFLDSHEYPRRTTNYFALPNEKAAQVRAAVASKRT